MNLALVEGAQITPLLYAQPFTSRGINHPANALILWTPAQLKKVGVLADVKTQKQMEIDMEFETSIAQMTAGYLPAERESWTIQEAEAQGYPANPTPMLEGLAAARGITVATIVTRVLANAAAFKTAAAKIIGHKQARSDALAAATTSIFWTDCKLGRVCSYRLLRWLVCPNIYRSI